MKRKRKKDSTPRGTKETRNGASTKPRPSRVLEKHEVVSKISEGAKATLLRFDLRVLSAKDLMRVSELTRKDDPRENLLDFEPCVLLENLPDTTSTERNEREVPSKVYALNRSMNENLKEEERYEQEDDVEDVAHPIFGGDESSRKPSLARKSILEKDEQGVDLRRLFWCVEEQGGWEEIRNRKGVWSNVMRIFDPEGRSNLSESYLESLYRNRSLPFRERWLREGKNGINGCTSVRSGSDSIEDSFPCEERRSRKRKAEDLVKIGLEEGDVHRSSLSNPSGLDGTSAKEFQQDVEKIRDRSEEEISCQDPVIEERSMGTEEEPEQASVPFDAIRSLGAVLSARETVLVEPDSDEEVSVMFR